MFRVEIDMSFKTENDAVSFLNLLQSIKTKFYTPTGSEEIPVVNTCRYHECFHDQIPAQPCGGYVNYDLSDPVVADVKNKAGDKIEATDVVSDFAVVKPAEPIIEE
jgi:hypothetical protein